MNLVLLFIYYYFGHIKKEYMVCCHLFSEDEYSPPASVCMDSDSDRERDTQAKELQA